MMRILVVEDEKLLCDGIAEDLELEKYTVERCYDGAEAYDLLLSESFDLLILDLNLPGMDGLDLLRAVRAEQPRAAGADPVGQSGVIRPGGGAGSGGRRLSHETLCPGGTGGPSPQPAAPEFVSRNTVLTVGGLMLDISARAISAGERPLELTPREFAILEHLMLHRDRWVSQEELMEHVLESDANPFSNVVRMHISSLQEKTAGRSG